MTEHCTTQGAEVKPEEAKALWEKHDHLSRRVGQLEGWREVAEYRMEQQARDAAADRERIGEQYVQLMSEIKALGGRVQDNELTHARQEGAQSWRRWAVPLAITGIIGVIGLTLTGIGLAWRIFGGGP